MLGWNSNRQYNHHYEGPFHNQYRIAGNNNNNSNNIPSNNPDLGLIDHIATAAARESRLTWDGRKGQWVPVTYTYTFPRDPFDQLIERTGNPVCGINEIIPRSLAKFAFAPSQRHTIMLDPGSPRLRVFPKASLSSGRKPDLLRTGPSHYPSSPLSHHRTTTTRQQQQQLLHHHGPGEETEDEELSYEPVNPFNSETRRPVRPMSWLDDIDIEDFLSSAFDYQQADGPANSSDVLASSANPPMSSSTTNSTSMMAAINIGGLVGVNVAPMSEPIYPVFGKRKRKSSSPCTPSSPPPPLFLDESNRPIPYFRPSPTREC